MQARKSHLLSVLGLFWYQHHLPAAATPALSPASQQAVADGQEHEAVLTVHSTFTEQPKAAPAL